MAFFHSPSYTPPFFMDITPNLILVYLPFVLWTKAMYYSSGLLSSKWWSRVPFSRFMSFGEELSSTELFPAPAIWATSSSFNWLLNFSFPLKKSQDVCYIALLILLIGFWGFGCLFGLAWLLICVKFIFFYILCLTLTCAGIAHLKKII
jgi:hypothetical protein